MSKAFPETFTRRVVSVMFTTSGVMALRGPAAYAPPEGSDFLLGLLMTFVAIVLIQVGGNLWRAP